MNETTCKPFKRWISVPYVPWVLWMSSYLFPCQVFWGLVFWCRSKAGVPHVRHKSLAPLRKILNWGDPSLLCVTTLRVGFWKDCQIWSLLPFLISWYLLPWRSSSSGLQLFLRRNWCICNYPRKRWVQHLPMPPSWT